MAQREVLGRVLGVLLLPWALVTAPYWLAQAARRRRRTGKDLRYQIVAIPKHGRSWDGFVVSTQGPASSRNTARWRGMVHHSSAFLDRDGTLLKIICFGPAERFGSPDAAARRAIEGFSRQGGWSYSAIGEETIAGERAVRTQLTVGRRSLTEWRLVHEGWFFIAGVSWPPETDDQEALARATKALDTWEWLGRGSPA